MSNAPRSDPTLRLRREAWAFGRDLRDRLLAEFRQEYGIEIAPPPALIIDELLTDFLGAELRYDPLPKGPFAQTEWINGRPVVTVNTLTEEIDGVKDAEGVQNVGKWHEGIHVVRHVDVIRIGPQAALPGFEAPGKLVCYRNPRLLRSISNEARAREFGARKQGEPRLSPTRRWPSRERSGRFAVDGSGVMAKSGSSCLTLRRI